MITEHSDPQLLEICVCHCGILKLLKGAARLTSDNIILNAVESLALNGTDC